MKFDKSMRVKTGIDRINQRFPAQLRACRVGLPRACRVGLIAHQASVDCRLRHAADICLASKNFRLATLFGPQHGFTGHTQDNMIEWHGFRDPRTGLPVYSLYGETRKPSPDMLDGIDALVIDMQDVGAKYYTFIWTMALCMEAAAEAGKAVVVLDRPNPLGGAMEGPATRPEWASFVGLKPLPVRHGMTIGEIALYLKGEFYPSVDLTVIPMRGWRRGMYFDETGLPWVMPSPNMPTLDTAIVYPGMCLLEGTNISEGRGTTRPFELFGAPFIDSARLIARLNDFRLPGVFFRPASFLPTFQKHAGELCGGAQIHVTSRRAFKPFKTAVAILKAVRELWPDELKWKEPPYEYESEKLPIDILAGSDRLRMGIDSGEGLDAMERWWAAECRSFARRYAERYRLYE
ncbi:MAG: DUF1343 domain-containing protein [Nitrospirae bacterium]|nr:DUF1343 domain-containing protein [Nitrospirota bacterium]